ncbi:hypothetical protein [Hymenobacter psoromatis]|uniref:hypothetical protein n=1 Tax=Hymenobacter psoromatis TaxID=1484116 RepID=UPI001CBADF0D|nr:hypothetical protein [Hymenobacter psoromatis]
MPKRQVEPAHESLSTDQMLCGLLAARPALLKMQQKQPASYAPLVAALVALDPDKPLPLLRHLQQQLGISAAVYRRWLEALHTDFLSAIKTDGELLTFERVEHIVYIHTFHSPECIEFRCRLPVTPRVGEKVGFAFLCAVAGSGDKYVHNVDYEYADDKVTVHVVLGDFQLGPHVAQLKDQAVFEGRTTHRELRRMSHDEMLTFLLKLYPAARTGPGPR